MSKVILVIENPTRCEDCPCYDYEWQDCDVKVEHVDKQTGKTRYVCPLQEIDDEVLKQLGIEE